MQVPVISNMSLEIIYKQIVKENSYTACSFKADSLQYH